MKNRKRGFSLVELLIVLAVIAALIATITPVALNAIRKSQATKVAQNIKTLAAAIENAAYVNGVTTNNEIKRDTDNAFTATTDIEFLGRDIDADSYGVWYSWDDANDRFSVAVLTNETVDADTAASVLDGLTTANMVASEYSFTLGINANTSNALVYTFTFDVY
ncbi:type II secretion system protein [Mesotoga sp. H07.pep.5.3]|uniref:type II secretion system protein n=1 Tax=Mesotoga sp. H07.pep.5.3 TaxID=1421003 RepID=UPI000C1998DC|nr:type II secretion system protein [Mesotoga sp. H07.pep.5.3]PIJ61087.1 hypothetical protein V513_11075 [Mesotoga sp. H07.pep.5.3]